MKHTKTLAVFAVMVMVLSGMTVVLANQDAAGGNALEDQGRVILDPSKDYNSNAENLDKLGLGESNWVQSGDKTTLTLNNIVYETKDIVGLDINVENTDADIVMEIVIKGTNKITTGNENSYTGGRTDFIGMSVCGVSSVIMSGDGSIELSNSKTSEMCGYGIYVEKDLTIKGCTVKATGSNTIGGCNSCGIMVDGNLTVSDGAKVLGYSGSVDTNAVPEDKVESSVYLYYICANGITVKGDLSVNNATIIGIGGDIIVETILKLDKQIAYLYVVTSGILVGGESELDNAILNGYAGNGIGRPYNIPEGKSASEDAAYWKTVYSVGFFYRDSVNAKNSDIYGVAGNATTNFRAASAGIGYLKINTDKANIVFNATNCNISGYGGISKSTNDPDPEQNTHSRSFGFGVIGMFFEMMGEKEFTFDMTLKDSVASFHGSNESTWSHGIFISKWKFSEAIEAEIGSITLDNSQLYVSGRTHAIDITHGDGKSGPTTEQIKVVGTPIFCAVSDSLTNPQYKTVTPQELVGKDVVSCGIGFHYNAFIMSDSSDSAIVLTYTVDDPVFTLPECMFEAPEGKTFAGWYVNGMLFQPGQTITLNNGPADIVASWTSGSGPQPGPQPEPGKSGSDNTLMIAIITAMIVIIVALFVAVVYKSRY